jgi:hypothetical protein
MSLSQDIITAFAKITNDNKKDNKETILYGTTVIQNGSRYVRIDGSNELTPVQSTAVIRSGARVTIMLKDHQAVVTGNLTDPSASSEDLGNVNDKVNKTEFELVINELLLTIEDLSNSIRDLTERVDKLENPEQ